MIQPRLSTNRLELRPAVAGDLDVLWALWRDPDVRRYLFDDIPVTRERTEGVLTDALALADAGLGLWMVDLRAPAAVIGCVGLLPVTTSAEYDLRLAGAIEPVVALAPAFWGRGYARESLRAVIAYAFADVQLSSMAAVTDAPNEASRRMLNDVGFESTGECDGPRYRMRTYTLSAERFALTGARASAAPGEGVSGVGPAGGTRGASSSSGSA